MSEVTVDSLGRVLSTPPVVYWVPSGGLELDDILIKRDAFHCSPNHGDGERVKVND